MTNRKYSYKSRRIRHMMKKVMYLLVTFVLIISILLLIGKNPFGIRYYITKYKTIIVEKYNNLSSKKNAVPDNVYVSLSELTDHKINEYLSINLPNDFYVMSEEEASNKYKAGPKVLILTNGKVDLTFQFNDDEYVENFPEEMSEYRDKTVEGMKKLLPDTTFDTDTTLEVDKKIIPIIKFDTYSNKTKTSNIVALIEVKTDLVIISMNFTKNNNYNQEMFYSILQTAKFQTW